MINGISTPTGHIGRIDQIGNSGDDSGNGNEHHKNQFPGSKIYKGEQDSSYSSGRAQGTIEHIVSVLDERGKTGDDDTGKIKEQEVATRDSGLGKPGLYRRAEKKQGEHIENQVHQVGMDKTGTDEPIVLAGPIHSLWPEQETLIPLRITKGDIGSDRGDQDDDMGV